LLQPGQTSSLQKIVEAVQHVLDVIACNAFSAAGDVYEAASKNYEAAEEALKIVRAEAHRDLDVEAKSNWTLGKSPMNCASRETIAHRREVTVEILHSGLNRRACGKPAGRSRSHASTAGGPKQ
jgi:hypothetical protein